MSKKYLFHFLLSFIIFSNLWGANEAIAQVEPTEPMDVSLVQLIANPSEYHGKLVRVIGYCRLAFEGDAIYLHREDSKHGITKNAVWIDVRSKIPISPHELNDKYILVEGIFNAKDKGHLSLYSGCLKKIKRIEYYPPRKKKEK